MDVLLVFLSVLSLVFSHEDGSRYGATQGWKLSKLDPDNLSKKTTDDFQVSFSLLTRKSPVSDERLNQSPQDIHLRREQFSINDYVPQGEARIKRNDHPQATPGNLPTQLFYQPKNSPHKSFTPTLYPQVADPTVSPEDFSSQSKEEPYALFNQTHDSSPKTLQDLPKALPQKPNDLVNRSHTNSTLIIPQTSYSVRDISPPETPTSVAKSIGVAHYLTTKAPRRFPTTFGANTRVLGHRLYMIPFQTSTAPDNTIDGNVNIQAHLTRLPRNPSTGISEPSQDSFDDQNMRPMFDHLPVGTPLPHDAERWGEFTANFITQPLYQSPFPGKSGIPLWMYRIDKILDMIEPIPGRYRAIQHSNGLIPQDLLPTYPCFLKFRKQKGHCNCGMKLKRRIVGGYFAKQGAHPWIAGFYTTTNPVRFCGGTILDKYWIVTAAHCFMKKRDLSTIRIGLGDYDVHTIDKYEHVRNVAQIIMHTGFNEDTGRNDIALVKVTKPIQFNFAMSPACLPYQFTNCTWMDDSITVIGWGRTMEGYHHPSVLREATVKVIDTQECRKKFKYVEFTNLCAHKEGTDTCQGDSGGPALMSVLGRSYIVGIVSWGVGCARPNKPGIYTSVSYYLDWIDQNTGGAQLCHM